VSSPVGPAAWLLWRDCELIEQNMHKRMESFAQRIRDRVCRRLEKHFDTLGANHIE
jgi:hypothetical protein